MITAILDHRDDLELVGALVYSEDKNGVDIGTLVGRDADRRDRDDRRRRRSWRWTPTASSTPRAPPDLDDVCAMLASGKNVVTTAFLFHPQRIDADRPRPRARGMRGRAAVRCTAAASTPATCPGVLPLALSGMSRTIDKITLQERADWSVYESTAITFDNMAFGQPVDEISPTATDFLAFNSSIFTEQVWFLGRRAGRRHRRGHRDRRGRGRQQDHQIFDHLLGAGTTAGQRWNWIGRRDGEPSSRSKRCGRWAASTRATGPNPSTAGR